MIATTSPLLWYLTRVSGLLALTILAVVAVLGVGVAGKLLPTGTARFLAPELHRRLSLTLLVVLAVHIATALADTFVPIGWTAALVPFLSRYRRAFVGLGTLAFDGLLVVVTTSLVRHRLGFSPWKRVHTLAWVILALALVHSLGTGSDARNVAILGFYGLATVVLVLATTLRLARDPDAARSLKVAGILGLVGLPTVVALWARSGPLQPGWSRRIDGTASAIVTSSTTARTTRSALPVGGSVTGTASTMSTAQATTLVLQGAIAGTNERVRFSFIGQAIGGTFQVEQASVVVGTTAQPTLCPGSLQSIDGSVLSFVVHCPTGTVDGIAELAISGQHVTGTVRFSSATAGSPTPASTASTGDDASPEEAD